MNENLSRIFPNRRHGFIGAAQAPSVVQPRQRPEAAR
jgi:hypothetical protein